MKGGTICSGILSVWSACVSHIRWFADEGLLAGERNDTKAEMGEYEVRIQSDDVYIYHNDNQIFIYDSTPVGFYTNEISECYYRE